MSKKLQDDLLKAASTLEADTGETLSSSDDALISETEEAALADEIALEQQYGDSDLRTFAESAASSASFGLTDQALVASGISTPEDLRERRERNSAAATTGEIAGIVGPALVSGGSSVLAKGAAAGVKTAAKAGLAAEQLTTKVLKKLIADTGKKSLAKLVLRKGISKGAGSAVEGSLYGLGKLISEEALGDADFNAENIIAHAGTSALFGGAVGAAAGTLQAVVPVIKGNKITSWVSKKVKGSLDPAKNAAELSGLKPSAIYKMKSYNKPLYEHTPLMLKDVANKYGLNAFSGNKKLFNSIKSYIDDTGIAIGKSLDDASEILAAKGALPRKSSIAQKVITDLNELGNQFRNAEGKILAGARPKIRKINRVINDFTSDLASSETITVKSLNELKSKYQKMAKWDFKGNLPLEEEINRSISKSLRKEVGELADAAGGSIGEKLKKDLLNYGSAVNFASNFGKHIDTQTGPNFLNIRDMFLGGMFGKAGVTVAAANKFAKSDLKRRLIVLTSIEKANAGVEKVLNSSVKDYLSGAAKKVPYVQTSTRALLNSKLAQKQTDDFKSKKPKSKQEAFINMQQNLTELQDPEKAFEYFNTSELEEVAPLAHAQSQHTLANAIAFLSEKIPKSSNPTNVFNQRPYMPSTVEMAKFEKYVQAIENPLSIFDELQNGTISRESAEAIETVYPNLYQRIQEAVINNVASNPTIPYKKRLSLGTLLNIPTDASLNPDYILQMQSHFKEAKVSQQGGSNTIPVNKASKLDMAESEATTVQKIAQK